MTGLIIVFVSYLIISILITAVGMSILLFHTHALLEDYDVHYGTRVSELETEVKILQKQIQELEKITWVGSEK